MATETAAKKTVAKKAPAAKASGVKAKPEMAKEASAGKIETKKTSPVTGKIKVTQMIGIIGRRSDQEATLIGLGLNKRHRSKILEDTPSVRGMIYKVRHLVKVEQA